MITRRVVVGSITGLALAPALPARAALTLSRRPVSFAVWRNGSQIGRHQVSFSGGASDVAVEIEAEMLVKLGPIPVFRYHHQATETWRDGRFAAFQSRTTSNGRVEEVLATRTEAGLTISRGAGRPPLQAPADTHPLTHWNPAVLTGALFNPQTGALIHEQVSRSVGPLQLASGKDVQASRYALRGDAQITDWYDEGSDWVALRARAPDGSMIDYRLEG